LPTMKFWPAEDYHQKYYRENPTEFQMFEVGSGRKTFEKKKWGDTKSESP
jgi:peptide methionine sulfoxide reductase MsrA